jgi:hypothetical protein
MVLLQRWLLQLVQAVGKNELKHLSGPSTSMNVCRGIPLCNIGSLGRGILTFRKAGAI